ncbi:uncharacterized protein ACBT44_001445 isoform 1-T1 [Syngnathus typhle]
MSPRSTSVAFISALPSRTHAVSCGVCRSRMWLVPQLLGVTPEQVIKLAPRHHVNAETSIRADTHPVTFGTDHASARQCHMTAFGKNRAAFSFPAEDLITVGQGSSRDASRRGGDPGCCGPALGPGARTLSEDCMGKAKGSDQ